MHRYDKEIATIERQLEATYARMREIHKEFMTTTIQYMRSWYMELTKQKVTSATKLTKQLGIEKISKMKSEVTALQEKTSEFINDFLNDVRLWWHMRKDEKGDKAFKENIQKALRLVAGKLGPILEKYGYITTDPNEPGYWREWDEYGIHRPPKARPYYPHHLEWTEPMLSMIDEYEELIRDAIQYAAELKKLKTEKAQSEVEDLWTKA